MSAYDLKYIKRKEACMMLFNYTLLLVLFNLMAGEVRSVPCLKNQWPSEYDLYEKLEQCESPPAL